jgi:hypothetical protein
MYDELRVGDRLQIGPVTLYVLRVGRTAVQLGFKAPRAVPIRRRGGKGKGDAPRNDEDGGKAGEVLGA